MARSVKLTKQRSLWAVFAYVYCSLVFVLVNGQSTTDDDGDKDQVSKLTDIVAELRAELNNVKSQLAELTTAKKQRKSTREFNADCPFRPCVLQLQRWADYC